MEVGVLEELGGGGAIGGIAGGHCVEEGQQHTAGIEVEVVGGQGAVAEGVVLDTVGDEGERGGNIGRGKRFRVRGGERGEGAAADLVGRDRASSCDFKTANPNQNSTASRRPVPPQQQRLTRTSPARTRQASSGRRSSYLGCRCGRPTPTRPRAQGICSRHNINTGTRFCVGGATVCRRTSCWREACWACLSRRGRRA